MTPPLPYGISDFPLANGQINPKSSSDRYITWILYMGDMVRKRFFSHFR
jgi:hypothetical protein